MNNLKYYNDALAYDFQMFMPKAKPEPVSKDNVIKMPSQNTKKSSKKSAAKLRVSSSAFAIFATVVLVGALCANLCMRIRVNELNSNINEAKTLLNEKQSECVALQMEYENRISYINLESEATELGMRKLDQNQVVYIRVNDKNMARNKEGKILTSNK